MERGSQGRALLGATFNAAADWNPGYCGSLRTRRRRRGGNGNRRTEAPKLSYAQHVARCHGEHLNEATSSRAPSLPSSGFRHDGGALPLLRTTMTRESALSTSSTPAAVPNGERRTMYNELRAIIQVQQQNADAVRAAQVRSRARERVALATSESARPWPRSPVERHAARSRPHTHIGAAGITDPSPGGDSKRRKEQLAAIEAKASMVRAAHEQDEAEKKRKRREDAKRVRQEADARRKALEDEADRVRREQEHALFLEHDRKRETGRSFRRHMRWRVLELNNAMRRRHIKRAVLTIERIWPTTPGCARARRMRTMCAATVQAAWRGYAARQPQRRRYSPAALAAALRAERADKGKKDQRRRTTNRRPDHSLPRARQPTVMRASDDSLATAAIVARARLRFGVLAAVGAKKKQKHRRKRAPRNPFSALGLGRAAAHIQRMTRGHTARRRGVPLREQRQQHQRAVRLDVAIQQSCTTQLSEEESFFRG